MTQPLIVSQLRAKQAEIEYQVEALTARLAAARANFLHIVDTTRLFDPEHAGDQPSTAYHGANKVMRSRDLFALCSAAMAVSDEPMETPQLPRHVIAEQGGDAEDHRLYLSVASRIGASLSRLDKRGKIIAMGLRGKSMVWRLAGWASGRRQKPACGGWRSYRFAIL